MTSSRIALSMLALASVVAFGQSPDQPTVSGAFLGDGKDGKIAHLIVQTREPFSDQAAIRLVFTEGLDWSDAPAAGAATAPTPTDASGIEAEVQKRLQEALKGLPKF